MRGLAAQFPDNPHVLYFLGRALLQECRSHEAVAVLEHLLQLHPEDADAKVALHKAQRLAPYSRNLPATAVAHMKDIKGCMNRNDFDGARDELARYFGELFDVPENDPRRKQAANVAMNQALDVANDWQQLAEDREHLIHELRGWIAQLTTGKEWLEKQWKYWEDKAKEDKIRWWRTPSKSVTRFLKSERPAGKTTN
jgi:predicted Zn-dependent protease